MNARTFILFACLAVHTSFAQGTFQNLGFESATVVPIPGDPNGQIDFATAFPGWIGNVNGTLQTRALYNDIFLSGAAVSLIDSGSTVGNRIEGNYTAVLQANAISGATETYLSQTATVPNDSLSLRFYAYAPNPSGFSVSLNGTALNLVRLQDIGTSFPFYSLYSTDVSSFAGQVAELRIINFRSTGTLQVSPAWVDSFVFSPDVVPEPSTWALFALGSALCWCATRRRRK